MKHLSIPAVALALLAVGCGSSSTTAPTTADAPPTFAAVLSPLNEVPLVTNSETTVSGLATIVLTTTKDTAGNITSATAKFTWNLQGIPAGSAINISHIHEGATTCACPVVVNSTEAPGQAPVTNGAASFTSSGIVVAPELAQRIINNPAAFYYNVHSTLNPGGVARGILVRTS